MIKAVIFDVDGVLVDSFEANHKFFSDLMEKFKYTFMSKKEYVPLFHLPMRDLIKHSGKLTDEEEIQTIWQAGKDREVPYPNELLNKPDQLHEAVIKLSKDYELGIATSRIGHYIFSMPQLADLKEYFKVAVGYEDTENHKPHPEPLILAAQKLGLKPEECVYVGDSESDIIAAKAAGMKSFLYNKKNLYNADYNFSSFQELPELIKSI